VLVGEKAVPHEGVFTSFTPQSIYSLSGDLPCGDPASGRYFRVQRYELGIKSGSTKVVHDYLGA
jgi:hypothetical protein